MEMFQKYPTILQTADAKKIIKNYNKLAKVLLEFEVLYHQAWMKQVENTDGSYDVKAERIVSKKGALPTRNDHLVPIVSLKRPHMFLQLPRSAYVHGHISFTDQFLCVQVAVVGLFERFCAILLQESAWCHIPFC